MRRLFWVSTGVALTVFVMVKGRKLVLAYTPQAVADRVATQATEFTDRAQDSASGFLADFREARAAREQELRDSLLADSQGSVADLRARRDAWQGSPRDAWASNITDDDSEDDELGYSF